MQFSSTASLLANIPLERYVVEWMSAIGVEYRCWLHEMLERGSRSFVDTPNTVRSSFRRTLPRQSDWL